MLTLYADDALLYFIINSTADCINLQTDLSTLQNGARHGKWSLTQPSANIFGLPTKTTLLILTIHYMATPYKKLLMPST